MAAKGGFSIADLQQGAKKLQATPSSDAKSGSKGGSSTSDDSAALNALEDLYEKHNGNLDLIFAELKADPSKAKKPHHRPKSAKEFAQKYAEGYYSLVDDENSIAESKSHK